MVAYLIVQESTKTKFITSDIMDVFNVVEKPTDGTPVMITTKEMSVEEYNAEVKFLATLSLSMKELPNGSK